MILNHNDYYNKTLGCWLGKNVGGTIGAPFEWQRKVNNITFYTQDLKGEAMPNDDLDIQLLWLCALEEKGIRINSRLLAEYWCLYVTPHWAEYGIAKTNMRSGLLPPLSGTFKNAYKHSCGAYIRSEIWACIAPGLPHIAVQYAYEDAILDHGNGEGMYAEIFMAALESAAFIISDLRKLIEIGLSYIPKDCGVAKAVHTTLECFDSGKTWLESRNESLRLHRGKLADWCTVSAEDKARGFDTGVQGYDVPSNIAMTLIGLLYGAEDFGKVQCIAVNCGEDTDCTAATAGSIWGIIHGAKAIPQKWIDPIGRGIKTVCLNMGELGYFGDQIPGNVDNLADRTMNIAKQVLMGQNAMHLLSDKPTDLKDADPEASKAGDHGAWLYANLNGPRFDFEYFSVAVDYGDGPTIKAGQPKHLKFAIRNTYKTQANLSLHWYLPEGWQVSPSADGAALSLHGGLANGPLIIEYTLTCDKLVKAMSRAVLEITIEGRPTVMLVPVALLNGSLDA